MQLYFYNGQPTNYSITKDGKVFNNKTQKFLKGQKNKNGYWSAIITTPVGSKRLYIHRMVLETYGYRKDYKDFEVNHKDGNKDNNNLSNLEWTTSSENKQHAVKNGLYPDRTIYGYNDNLEIVSTFSSIAEMFRITGWSPSEMSKSCLMNPKSKNHSLYWSFEKIPNFTIAKIESGKSKSVGKFDLNGELLEKYSSMSDAARANDCSRTHIGECCNGKIKTYKSFIWKYL